MYKSNVMLKSRLYRLLKMLQSSFIFLHYINVGICSHIKCSIGLTRANNTSKRKNSMIIQLTSVNTQNSEFYKKKLRVFSFTCVSLLHFKMFYRFI